MRVLAFEIYWQQWIEGSWNICDDNTLICWHKWHKTFYMVISCVVGYGRVYACKLGILCTFRALHYFQCPNAFIVYKSIAFTFFMMTSSNGNIFCVTGHLCGEFTGGTGNSTPKGQWRGALMFHLMCSWLNGWVTSGEAGDLRRRRAHYGGTVLTRPTFAI